MEAPHTYPAELVALELFGLATTEPTLINQIGQLLIHQILDLLHSGLKAFLGGAGDAQVQRRVLGDVSSKASLLNTHLQQQWPWPCPESIRLG